MGHQTRLLALRRLFAVSHSVTCTHCGKELKGETLPRLARLGCPQCGGTQWDFHTSEDIGRRVMAAVQ